MKLRYLVVPVVLAAAAAALATTAVWAARQHPGWYTERVALLAEADPAEEPGGLAGFLGSLLGIETRHTPALMELMQELGATGQVVLDGERLGAVLETAISATSDGRVLLAATADPLARIANGHVEFGGLVDLDQIDAEALDEPARAALERLRAWAPALRGRQIYVGMRAVPAAVDGDLHLSRDAAVVIGRLVLPRWLIPAGDLWGQLDIDLRWVELTRAEVQGEELTLATGAAPRD